ncbi:MAG TPA: response regulator transcription factor [Acidimicrobiales bacterium]
MEPEVEMIRVLVADDEERFRRVVFALLQDEPDIEVVGHASDGAEAVAVAQELAPDLVLLDVRMPGMHGIQAATAIRRLLPTTKVIMLTASAEEDDVFEALKAGAGGYILKEGLVNDLAQAVRVVAQDLGLLLSPSIASKVLTEFKEAPRRASAGPGLTERELQVLRLVSQGFANHEIAEQLHLSGHTVKRHVANILAKLHQRSRLDAVMFALRSGVLASETG